MLDIKFGREIFFGLQLGDIPREEVAAVLVLPSGTAQKLFPKVVAGFADFPLCDRLAAVTQERHPFDRISIASDDRSISIASYIPIHSFMMTLH